ncbi:gamma-glutamyl-gamma-aminobutyrate hydrolase family protein [Paenibacillus sp. HJGM_3]|uniref:gamma-glutamyl-gamma-aminobutyrate hydrolase family protein n=1 Tax=Paenibacillus sp. HJGM_3 TaxID=3379816 RepID=UPI00385B97AE
MSLPLIAVTSLFDNGHTFLHRDYTDSVIRAGGLPLAVPALSSPDWLDRVAELADGLLLSGGEDVDPNVYGEEPLPGLGTLSPERDFVEAELARRFLAADKPIFAICRGLQLLNAIEGGTLLQDIERQHEGALQHKQLAPRAHLSHRVNIASGTLLERILGSAAIPVNSFHHQAVRQAAPGYRINAVAGDGIIEGIESPAHRFVLGVQWHPENLSAGDPAALQLFRAFVEACKARTENPEESRELHA